MLPWWSQDVNQGGIFCHFSIFFNFWERDDDSASLVFVLKDYKEKKKKKKKKRLYKNEFACATIKFQ
jgi:hypothetical protein